jgi:hypothetical protein
VREVLLVQPAAAPAEAPEPEQTAPAVEAPPPAAVQKPAPATTGSTERSE